MSNTATVTIDEIKANKTPSFRDFVRYQRAVHGNSQLGASLRNLIESERLHDCKAAYHMVLGNVAEAEYEATQSDSVLASVVYAKLLIQDGRYADGLEYAKFVSGDANYKLDGQILCAKAYAGMRDYDQLAKCVEKIVKTATESAEAVFARALLLEAEGQIEKAIEVLEQGVEKFPDNEELIFRLACDYDLYGEDDRAIEMYRRLVCESHCHVNAALNLGILFEDREEYARAAECFRLALKADPNNDRARLYVKDTDAALNMVVDEDQEKKDDIRTKILDTPVTDFELSVRSRNCLARVGIHTLRDLIAKPEQELLNYKNFGETSLSEIKELLHSKGLRLGQGLEEDFITPHKTLASKILADGKDKVLEKPIAALELSVRSRKCLETLAIETIGDLVNKTEKELLAVKNFGQTSMTEIKLKLKELGLSLRNFDEE